MPKKSLKGAEMSEEERLVKQQQRVQAEEETAKKKEETLALYLKDKLQREERNTALNLLKLNEGWRRVLRQAQEAELRNDVAVLQQMFERQLDELNSVIEKLVCYLQEAELQEAQVQRSHLQHVDRLWAQQTRRLEGLQQHWESGLQDLSSTCRSETKKMLTEFQQQQDKLQDHQLLADQRRTDETEAFHRMYREALCKQKASIEDQADKEELQENVLENLQALQLAELRLNELDKQVSTNRKQISVELKNAKRLKDKVVQLQQQFGSREAENDLMQQDLTAAGDEAKQKCRKQRDQLARDRRAARRKLTELSIQSDAIAKKLQATISKGERLQRVAETCHKLEVKQELLRSSSVSTEEHGQEFGEFEELQRRLNVALLHREALRSHQQDLSRQNEQLELLLLRHDGGLEGHRSVLLASRAPTTSVPPAAERRHVIVEAAHAVRRCL